MGDDLHPFGRYLLIERLRKGGMAEVYRAVRKGGDGKVVAIKRLLPQLATDPELVSMFLNEARLVAVLRHRHIAQVLDLGRIDEDYFIALEYVAGQDLRSLFARGQQGAPLPPPLLALVAAQVCDALDFAHRKLDAAGAPMGIVHRDVSPENVLVSYEGEAKLIDFGVAKVADAAVKTQTGVLKGKFCYMSPEQVLAVALDRRSDLFSTGVVLWELATGQRLFLKDSDFATLKAVAHERVVPPGDLNPELPPALERSWQVEWKKPGLYSPEGSSHRFVPMMVGHTLGLALALAVVPAIRVVVTKVVAVLALLNVDIVEDGAKNLRVRVAQRLGCPLCHAAVGMEHLGNEDGAVQMVGKD